MTCVASNSELVLKKIKELPPLPLVIHQLLKVMDDPNSSAAQISKVLAGDQALAAKVLKLVNSSYFGLSGKISTISRAVVILGVGSIRNLALGLSVSQIMATGEKGELQARFWEHSLAAAAAAETLAKANGYGDPEEAFVAGLLHDIGHLVFLMARPKEIVPLLSEIPPDILDQEKNIMGMTHAQAGQKLLKHWKLPRTLVQATRFHHHGPIITGSNDPLASIVAMADALASIHGKRYEQPLEEQDFLELIKVTGMDVEMLGGMLDTMSKRIDESRVFLKGSGDDQPGKDPEAEALLVTMICTDPVRTAWAQQILKYFRYQLMPMNQFLSQASDGEFPDLVIVHPASISEEELAQITPTLARAAEIVVLYGEDDQDRVSNALGRSLPRLPLGFSRQDLQLT